MKDFYIDFSEYPEAVASVLYEEVQKHAFELGCIWKDTTKTIEKYEVDLFVLTFTDNEMSMWIGAKPTLYERVSVEDFLKMEKEPEYRVGMPMENSCEENLVLYLNSDGALEGCFTGIALKHDWNEYQYSTNGYYDPCCWKPIDPSRIKVTIK